MDRDSCMDGREIEKHFENTDSAVGQHEFVEDNPKFHDCDLYIPSFLLGQSLCRFIRAP